ncbi:glycerol-3-phosphate dehydrogenase, partial [Aquabacterium sp.]|uniref:glycerol-3-phosphate dehydrogenase n=1 Tax=Aquabacterium sp. TaxID=1872578 RepID=UPI0025C4B575
APPGVPPEADHHCDVLVVGGGIHGVGTARDLAGRGWRVMLCEQHDLASHTSSASTKMLHGGVRDLAHGEWGRVRRALAERDLLLHAAPHITWPLRFVLPLGAGPHPAWQVRLGLWLYDQLAPQGRLPPHQAVGLARSPLGAPLQSVWGKALVYADAWVDDARLVSLCALDAAEQGALVLTRTRVDSAVPHGQGWRVGLVCADALSGTVTHRLSVQAGLVVNAAGPWADALLHGVLHGAGPDKAEAGEASRLVKGSHIVVPRCFDHDHAYTFYAQDGRLLFAIPYERDFTLIGSSEMACAGDPARVDVDPEEVVYLCQQTSRYLRRPVLPGDVVWQFAGVRRVQGRRGAAGAGEAAGARRHERLQASRRPAPWVTVWGGQLTTFREQAERAANLAGELLGERRHAWTGDALLPGAQLTELLDEALNPELDMVAFQARLRQRHPWLDLPLARRWSRAYGSRV